MRLEREKDAVPRRSKASRKARWAARQLSFAVELSEAQLRAIAAWNGPGPADGGREIRRDRRAGVTGAATGFLALLLLGLLLLIWLHFASRGLLP